MKEHIDSTLSFISSISGLEEVEIVKTENLSSKINVDIIDPVFTNIQIEIPRKIETLFKSVEEIKYIYKITDTDFISIYDTARKVSLKQIRVCFFENFNFNDKYYQELFFICNREKYKRKLKSEQRINFKKSLKNNVKFEDADAFETLRQEYFQYQIDKKCNFVYIDNGESLHRSLKSIVSFLQTNDEFIPKTKKVETKQKFIEAFLAAIPGVSTNLALQISLKYNSFSLLQKALEDKDKFCIINMDDVSGQTIRVIPDKIYFRIYKSLLGNDKDEYI